VDENVFQVSGATVPAKPMAASNGQLVSKVLTRFLVEILSHHI